jgi:flagellar basal body-associated protein FliL
MNNSPQWLSIIIVLAPIALFIVLLIAVRVAFKKAENDSFQALLNEPDAPDPDKKKSTSRFILFLTSLTTLIITSCLTSYYFYMKIYQINSNVDLQLEDFTKVLLSLGIGVVPYAVNQVKKISL